MNMHPKENNNTSPLHCNNTADSKDSEYALYLNTLEALRLGLLQSVCYRVKWLWKLKWVWKMDVEIKKNSQKLRQNICT